MDLNQDGIKDIVSGSYRRRGPDGRTCQGEIYFFAGLGGSKYAAGEVLTGMDGKPLEPGWASNVAVADWERNGTPDLIVGTGEGPVKFYANRGKMTFDKPVDLSVSDGQPLSFHEGSPCVVDWDGDGVMDLIIGEAFGSVQFLKGKEGEKGQPQTLAPAIELIAIYDPKGLQAVKSGFYMVRPEGSAQPTFRPAGRVRPTVTDWNGDGKLDLLIGDVVTVMPFRKLSPEESVEKQRVESAVAASRGECDAIEEALRKQAAEEAKVTYQEAQHSPKKKKALGAAFDRLKKASTELRAAEKRLRGYEGQLIRDFSAPMEPGRKSPLHGYVWLYLRQ